MSKLISVTLSVIMLVMTAASGLTSPASAQQTKTPPNPTKTDPRRISFLHSRPLEKQQLPAIAGTHRKEEYRRIWDSLTPEKRKEIWATFQKYVGPSIQRAYQDQLAQQKAKKSTLGNEFAAANRPIDPCWDCGGNLPPHVTIFAAPTSGVVPLSVNFSANAYDPDGYITGYYWDFGDGSTANGSITSHTYFSAGTYLASVTVFDDYGEADVAYVNITVTQTLGNQPPQAFPSASPTSGQSPLTVNFQANASDADGYVASYNWNFGDGSGSTAANPSHTYQSAGNFVATVSVTDDLGASGNGSVTINVSPPAPGGPDADGDGLPEEFEKQVADNFTPGYFSSLLEFPGTGFALFQDRPDAQVVTQIFPTTFPQTATSYYRVTPLGVVNGKSYLQIDYLGLWNRDDGLAIGNGCLSDIDFLDFFGIWSPAFGTGLLGHNLDNERSAIRIAAPAVNGTFNLDANAYKVDRVFTAAHEDEPNDHSDLRIISPPQGPEFHIAMFSSLSKHATYLFYPDYLPLLPYWIIDAIYGGVAFACIFFDPYLCNLFYWIADEVVFYCMVEHHLFQGGVFARPDLRTNVGELPTAQTQPLPGGRFIQVPALTEKLLKHFDLNP